MKILKHMQFFSFNFVWNFERTTFESKPLFLAFSIIIIKFLKRRKIKYCKYFCLKDLNWVIFLKNIIFLLFPSLTLFLLPLALRQKNSQPKFSLKKKIQEHLPRRNIHLLRDLYQRDNRSENNGRLCQGWEKI